jgi:hypothetical protein
MLSKTPPHRSRDMINRCWINPKVHGLDRIAIVSSFINRHGRQSSSVVGDEKKRD